MRYRLFLIGWGLTLAASVGATQGSVQTASNQQATLDRYCATCHSQQRKTAGLVLEHLDMGDVGRQAPTLEKVVKRLRNGTMPPPGSPRPDQPVRESLASWLETSLDAAAAAHPNPGRMPAVHRLNRAEYANAIRDLLGIDTNIAAWLPPDDSGYGFDNIADVLSVSPMLAERYLTAAQRISRLAVGDTSIRPATDTFSVNKYLRQDDRISDDLPFGSRGDITVRYYFPVDAEYVLKIFLDRTYDGRIRGLGDAHTLEVRLNGAKVQELPIGGEAAGRGARVQSGDGAEVKIPAVAGPAVITVTFLKKATEREGMLRPSYAVTSYEYAGDIQVPPSIASVELRGPYDVKGPGSSPSRARIFICNTADERCATTMLSTLTRRAFRRPVTARDVEPFLQSYRDARRSGSFDAGIQAALRRILVSPEFLFRVEDQNGPARSAAAVFPINDIELASRLSFFLWSSIPDDELLGLAEKRQLRVPSVLDAQVRRMLGDRRANALVDNFAGQWLYLRNIRLVQPDPIAFPDFDENLRLAFEREMTLFLQSQLREDRSVGELLTADYTYVNERLARHYGLPNVYGNQFRRVTLTDDARKGVLGKGAVLTLTSYPNRTSPVLRGKWLLDNILGAPPAAPPPNVPALQENHAGDKPRSIRERMEQHRADPGCASCHRLMDPLGFALENFDAIGRWRTTADGVPVDASGSLADGTKVDGPRTLRAALVAHRDEFAATVTEKLLTYALGRGLEPEDAPAVRQILRAAAPNDYRWSSLILGIVKTVPFQYRQKPIERTQ